MLCIGVFIVRMYKNVFRMLIAAFFIFSATCFNSAASQNGQKDGSANDLPETTVSAKNGQYLATIGNCMACHTAKNGAAFAGGTPFYTDFGVIYSTNITPDVNAGIGTWSEKQFIRAMHEGISPNGINLYPAFPYPSFTKVLEDDIKDIFAFLKTVPASSHVPPENEMRFPFDQRVLMRIWNWLFVQKERYVFDKNQSATWNRGKYLIDGLGHCGTCHTPRNLLGGKKNDLALSGGSYQDLVKDKTYRPWSAVNLTPSADGLGAWSEQDLVDYLSTGHSARAGTFGPMNEVIKLSTSQATDTDISAMANYLKNAESIQRSSRHTMVPEKRRAADILYTVHCGTCHLPTGLGYPSLGSPLAGSSIVQAEDPSSLINVIIYGAAIFLPAPPAAWKSMEAFGNKLDDNEIALISTYLRSSWGNLGSAVSDADVRKQR